MATRVFAALGLTLGLAACGGSCSSKERVLEVSDLEKLVRDHIKEPGKYTPPVYCPRDLDAYVGAETTCWMPIAGRRHDIRVVITAVDGRKVEFDIEVADDAHDAGPDASFYD